MELQVLDSIELINPSNWNSLLHESDVFNTHQFLSALESAKVEDAETKYLCFYNGKQLISTSVVSVFNLNLSLFIGNHSFVQFIKNISPTFFNIKVLFVGTPLSAGQNHLRIIKNTSTEQLLESHIEWVNNYCKEHGIKHSIFKEFEQIETDKYKQTFIKKGFFKAYSIPSIKMNLEFENYNEYLGALRSGYRRQIKISFKKANIESIQFADYSEAPRHNQGVVFSVAKITEFNPQQFYQLYLNVLDRAEVKLETLNLDFFESLFKQENSPIKLLTMWFNGKLLGVFAFSIIKDDLTFIWTAKSESKDKYHSYQNLLQALISYGISAKCKNLVLGQTAYYPKMRIGGEPEELYLFYKAHKHLNHSIMQLLNSVVFPKLKVQSLNVFKQ